MTAGIFVNVVAAASEEDREDGRVRVTPYWRCLKKNGELNAKYPGGLEGHRKLLEEEGHIVLAKGKRLFVKDYAEHLHTSFAST